MNVAVWVQKKTFSDTLKTMFVSMLTVALGKSRIAGISINTEFHRSVVEVLPVSRRAVELWLMYKGGCKAIGSQNHQNHHKWGL